MLLEVLEERLFRLLLRAYPARFRARYGAELEIFFRAERQRPHNRGVLGALRFWRHTCTDTLAAAMRHRRSSIPGPTPMLIHEIPRHIRTALRGMRGQPAFVAVIILSLAIGMSAALVVSALADAALLEALPFADGNDLYFIDGTLADDRQDVRAASYPEIERWREGTSTFEGVAAVSGTALNLVTEDLVERVVAEIVGSDYFLLRRARPLLGRVLGAEDNRGIGQAPVVVIRETLWDRVFDRRAGILGERITLNDRLLTVVGVMPADFEGMAIGSEAWVPASLSEIIGRDRDSYGNRWMSSIARLKDGTSLESAQAALDAAALELADERPDTNANRTGTLIAARTAYLDGATDLLSVLLGAALLLLVIAAANVAGLLVVKAEAQASEHALCLALGARRRSVGLRVVVECLLLTAIGAGLGWLAAQATLMSLVANLPTGALPSFVVPRLDATSLFVMAGLIVVTTAVAALVPAFLVSRGDLTISLRAARGGGRDGRHGGPRPQQVLVVAQVAITLVLLVGTGLMARTLATKLDVPSGFDADNLHAFRLRAPVEYDDATLGTFATAVQRQLAGIPGIVSASYGSDVPLRGGSSAGWIALADEIDEPIRYYRHRVAANFLESIGARVVAGRTFTAADSAEAPNVALVSRAFAARAFGARDPLGQTLVRAVGFGDIPVTVVGIVDSIRWRDLTTDLLGATDDPDVYFPFSQDSRRVIEFVIRAEPGVIDLPASIREAVRGIAPGAPVYQFVSLSEQVDQQTAGDRLTLSILGTFGGASLLLAGVGVYGALAHAVRRRQREIAIRMAVGAPGAQVRRRVLGEGLRLAAIGAVFGLAVSAALARLVRGLLFGVSAFDPMTYGLVLVAVSALAIAATWIPAARATRVDPQAALRAE